MSASINTIASLSPFSTGDGISFFQPCWGFKRAYQAEKEARRVQKEDGDAAFNMLRPLVTDRRTYLPRDIPSDFNLSDLLRRGDSQTGKVIWQKLAECGEAKPEGAYNLALLIEGRRRYWSEDRRTQEQPSWWHRLTSGLFDCCAVWDHADTSGSPVSSADEGTTRVYAARHGRGAVYARRARFDYKGKPCGFTTRIVLVKFEIFDADELRDDMLKLRIVASRTALSTESNPPLDPCLGDLDDGWQMLGLRARAIFDETCQSTPEHRLVWRRQFVEQRDKWQMQRAIHADVAFWQGIESLPWDEVMQLVQEPWQLQAVVEKHCDNRFDPSADRKTSMQGRVYNMIRRFECSDERHSEMYNMAADYLCYFNERWRKYMRD